ncbi:MAG: hypothetical protein NWE98_03145 [Candidatus Bathyarchaeota archaeon]|nr:hypothetical protein [Candidatus Bathyarchaeota archaeon]
MDDFLDMKEQMRKKGLDDETFAGMFSSVKGLVLLDTCGNIQKCRETL